VPSHNRIMSRVDQSMFARYAALTKNLLVARAEPLFSQHTSLIKNSGAMALGAGFTSVFGFVYWCFAARSFSPEALGIASAIISLMGLVGIVGDAGLSTLVVGEIVRWPERKYGLIAAAIVTCVCACLTLGLISLPLSQFVLSAKSNIIDDIIIVIGCGLTGLSMISDQAFVGMLQSSLRMLRQFCCSILRVVLIVLFSIWISNEHGILISWIASLGLSLMFGELLMRRYHQSYIHQPDFDLLLKLKTRAIDHYMLDLGMMAPAVIMPYAVTVLISATSNAAFTAIWLAVGVGSLVPSALATVLFPVLRAEPEQYREKMRISLLISLVFSVVFAFVLLLSSQNLLTIFNPLYVEIEHSYYLGILGFGLIGAVVRYHVAAAARLGNRMRRASAWVCIAGLFELAAACVGSLYGGLAGLSIGWVIATMIEGIAMWVFANPCSPPENRFCSQLRVALLPPENGLKL
jgi:O-antigen/teichoic acid export membrane protein